MTPRSRPPPAELIIDLDGRLGADVEALPGYEGVGWAGDAPTPRAGRGTPAGPDHRPEPAGPLRPAGLAGVPGAARRRATTSRSSARRARATRPYQVVDGVTHPTSTARTRRAAARSASSSSTRTRSSRPRGWCCRRAGAGRFDVIQACNPPDIFWPHRPLAAPPRRHAVRVRPPRPVPGALRLALPRRRAAAATRPAGCSSGATFRTADHVISTNESYRRDRDRAAAASAPADVTVVRTGPDPERLRRAGRVPGAAARPRPPRRLPRRHGPAGRRRPRPPGRRRTSCTSSAATTSRFTFMGAGDCYDDLVALRDELGLPDYVELPGPGARRRRRRRAVDRRRRAVARPEEPAQRRLDDEQDDGVHGLRAAGRRVRPPARPGSRPARPRSTCEPTTSTAYARAIVGCSTTPPSAQADGRARAGRASRTSWPGRTSGPPTSRVYDRLRRAHAARRPSRGRRRASAEA